MLRTQTALLTLWLGLSRRVRDRDWRDDRGMTTETVIITAILATLALAAGAIIYTKVFNKANNIDVGG
jgi:hypothetical protein